MPQTDLSEAEVEKLDNFLNDQEDLKDRTVVCLLPGMTEVSNLEAFINEWGLSETGQIVYDNDANHQYMKVPSYLDDS
ncbi:MAG: hypothetical protein ACLSB9_26970 [Hydrogeniiclostridium mannosilyticum]